MAEQSLRNKTVKGVGWSAADAFLAQGVSFVVGLVLARLLSPEEYGLIGIVTIFTTIMLGVVDSGFSNALIRKSEVTDDDYSTLFIFNLAVSVLMFALLFAGAPYIAVFFERPQLVGLVRVMGLLLILQALSIVQNTILSRRIDFKTKTKASFLSAFMSGVFGIAMAFMGFGVWSLVAQQLSRQLLYSGLLWGYNRWWPKFKFSVQSLKYMWGFGWKLLVSGLLDNLWKELYQTVVGKFYSPATLGQYTRSKEYARIFSSNLTIIVQRVSYPVLAKIQDDKTRMISGYRRIIKTTMFITATILISLGAIADPLIYCLIGPKWHIAATFLPLICISMSLYPLHAINLNMLQVQGRTDIFLYLEILKKIIAIGPICLGIFVDIYWMLVGSICSGIIAFFLNSYYTGKNLGYTSWKQLKDIAPSYGISFVIAISVYFFKFLPISNWLILPIQIIVGVIVFFLICETTKLEEYLEVKGIALQFIAKIRSKRK
jgi:O-antigen/teichoic acid export membrane protein